jgi:hypothetical protein
MSLSPVITSAASLQRLDGVAGVMLFKGQNTIHRQMPFSDMRADNLREIISQMLDGYRQVRRRIHQIYLEFDGGVLLLVLKDEAVMLFFLTSRADSDLAASAASVMLNDHAELLHAASTDAAAGVTACRTASRNSSSPARARFRRSPTRPSPP